MASNQNSSLRWDVQTYFISNSLYFFFFFNIFLLRLGFIPLTLPCKHLIPFPEKSWQNSQFVFKVGQNGHRRLSGLRLCLYWLNGQYFQTRCDSSTDCCGRRWRGLGVLRLFRRGMTELKRQIERQSISRKESLAAYVSCVGWCPSLQKRISDLPWEQQQPYYFSITPVLFTLTRVC